MKRTKVRSWSRGSALGCISMLFLLQCEADAPLPTGTVRHAMVSGEIAIRLPAGFQPGQAVFSAMGSAQLDDRVSLLEATGAAAQVTNTGTGQVNVGVESLTGHVTSEGDVLLRDRSTVQGNVTTAGNLLTQNQTTVTGTITEDATLTPLEETVLPLNPPASSQGAVHVEPGQQQALAPGRYDAVSVKSNSTLTLAAGTYWLDSLNLEPQANLALDDDEGPVIVVVTASVFLKGTLGSTNGGHPRLFLAATGNSAVFVETAFAGTLVAPHAALKLGSQPHAGSFYAHHIEAYAGAQVTHQPFSDWGSVCAAFQATTGFCRTFLVQEPRTVDPPGTPSTIERPLDPTELPETSGGVLSPMDGGQIFLAFPHVGGERTTLSATEVRDGWILPILATIGADPATGIGLPPEFGVTQPPADPAALAQIRLREYDDKPDLLRPRTFDFLTALLTPDTAPDPIFDLFLSVGEGMTFSQFVAGLRRLEIYYFFQQLVDDTPVEHTGLLATRYEGETVSSTRGTWLSNTAIVNQIVLTENDLPGLIPDALASLGVQGMLCPDGLGCFEGQCFATCSGGEFPCPGGTDPMGVSPCVCVPTDGSGGPACSGNADDASLLLLPVGANSAGVTELRYSYRFEVPVTWEGLEGSYELWLDAETGEVLKADPWGFDTLEPASGLVYRQSPDQGSTLTSFEIDDFGAQVPDTYTLSLDGFMTPIRRLTTTSGADLVSDTAALEAVGDFADETNVECSNNPNYNRFFQQISLFSNVQRMTGHMEALGVPDPYEGQVFSPIVEAPQQTDSVTGLPGCNARSNLNFSTCGGMESSDCPQFVPTDPFSLDGSLNPALDATVWAHELGHTISATLTSGRQLTVQEMTQFPNTTPLSLGEVEDMPDIFAAHVVSTNCIGGYFSKNAGGVNFSVDCASHGPRRTPRKFDTPVPFAPAPVADRIQPDHFPEYRDATDPTRDPRTSVHADGHVAAAAAWFVRQGMRSKCRPSGTMQFAVRLVRALKKTGFREARGSFGDRYDALTVYRAMTDVLYNMAEQWAHAGRVCAPGDAACENGPPAFRHNGAHTINKVMAGFAKAGLFMLHDSCISTDDTTCCQLTRDEFGDLVCDASAGIVGADSVVDIFKNEPLDDVEPVVDYLRPDGPPPTFRVWTGPRYNFDGTSVQLADPAPCNSRFRVDVSVDPTFQNAVHTSDWVDVSTDGTEPQSCYGEWTPNAATFQQMIADLESVVCEPDAELGCGMRVFYRAVTTAADGTNERDSLAPGLSTFGPIGPPYFVLTPDGQSDL